MVLPLRETFALPSWMLSLGVMGAGAQIITVNAKGS